MRYKLPIKIIELESDNYHLVVFSEFQDGTKVNWVIDTGASKTVFDKNLAAQYLLSEDESEELHSAGINDETIKTSIGYLNPFVLGSLKVEHLKVALLDMSHINELYSKAVDIQICGLIGSDFLVNYGAVIDYKRKRLVLSASKK
uniref:retropepsin-like aspartic protease n=1 Tax=uncultured Draconibacterium sp. TaxID=1573823 RepID=UPI0032171FD8